ncbi:hypothetical protein [Nocardia sp. NPDC051463]|uniref:hypothetical protein n=1 Tax=Nocardia sp. NPDC051463 TaxID=3154845 RepID=UPI003447F80D
MAKVRCTQSLSRQFVQRTVNDAAADLVEFQPNPLHQRSPLIALTPAGTSAITAAIRREHALPRRTGGAPTPKSAPA